MRNQKPLSTRVLSLVLTAAILLSTLPATVFATEGDVALGTSSTEKTTRTITAFDELGEGFIKSMPFDGHTYALSVALNTPIEDIKLPTELKVTVERTTTPPTKDEVVDSGKAPEDNPPPAKDKVVDSGKAPEDNTPANVPEDNAVTTQEAIPVTWKGDRAYTPAENSKVIYTAVLPEGYALKDGVALPTIYVAVGRQARAGTVINVDGVTMTLSQALDIAVTDDILKLTADIDLGAAGVTITTAKSITIDLNGHKLTSSGSSAIAISTGTLTIIDGAIGGGGTVSNTSNGDVISITVEGAVNINGGKVSAANGKGIYNNASTGAVNINGGTVSAASGVGIMSTGTGEINIKSGGTVSVTGINGRGIFNYQAGIITVSGGTVSVEGTSCRAIENNSLDAVNVSSGSTVSAEGNSCTAIYNNADGAVNVSGGMVSATNGAIYAIYNNADGAVNVSGGTVSAEGTSCTAIYNSDIGVVTVSGNATVTSQNATLTDGTIYFNVVPTADPKSILNVEGTATVSNTATPEGYSVYFAPTEVTVDNVASYYTKAATATVGRVRPSKSIISFDARNGTTIPDVEVDKTTNTITMPDAPTWTGYTFDNWYTGIDGTGTVFVNSGLAASATIYAKWIKDTKIVTTEPMDFTTMDTTDRLTSHGWAWDKATKTFTINGLLFDRSEIGGKDGTTTQDIYLPAESIIDVAGVNTVIATGNSTKTHVNRCICGMGKLLIQGKGTLNVSGSYIGISTKSDILTISGATVHSEADALVNNNQGIAGYYGINIKDNATVSAKGIYAAFVVSQPSYGAIIAKGATVTGAKEEFTSGETKTLKQESPDTPVVFSFDPSIAVGTQTGEATYGTTAALGYTVTGNNFGGSYPAFAPQVEWVGTAPTGVAEDFTESDAKLTITTAAATPAGEYKFKVVSPKASPETGNYESAEATLTVGKATPTVSVAIEKKATMLRTVIGDRNDTFIIKATITGANSEKPEGTVVLSAGSNTIASNVTVTDGVATYEWVKPEAGTYAITAKYTSTDTNNFDATSTAVNVEISDTPFFDGNDLYAQGIPILLIKEADLVNAYWDKNGNGIKDTDDTLIAKTGTTEAPSNWNIYGGKKLTAMAAASTSQITLYCGGFASINAGSKVGGDAPAGTGVNRTLRVATTEALGTLKGFNLTEYKVDFDANGGSYATACIWQAQGKGLVAPNPAPPIKAGSTFMGFFDETGTRYYYDNLKPAIATFTANAPVKLLAKWSEGTGIFAGRYSHYQVFDCKRTPANPKAHQPFRVFNFAVPYIDTESGPRKMTEAEVEGKIFSFEKTGDATKPFRLMMADDINGTKIKAISSNGQIFALGKEGLLFVSQGSSKGYFISLSQGFNYGDEVTYSPTNEGPISEETASNHPNISPTPWDPNESWAVTFNSQSADTIAMPSQMSVRKFPETVLGALPIPIKENYLFKGWFTQPKGLGIQITQSTVLTENITAYANWESSIFKLDVTLKDGTNLTPSAQFGTGKGIKDAIWTGVVLAQSGYKLPLDNITVTVGGTPLTNGYKYISATGEITINKEKMTDNVVIDITPLPISYTVVYHANGAKGKPSVETQPITFGIKENAAVKGGMNTDPEDWTFKGWARTVDATAAEYLEGVEIGTNNPVTLTDGATVKLYAVWDAKDAKVSLQNGSFENPIVTNSSAWQNFTNGTPGLEWLTTAQDKKHELVRPIKNLNATYKAFNTRVASEGEQFAELNANGVGALYQEVKTIPESTLYWGADHRGRSKSGVDTMQIWIGTNEDINTALNQYIKAGNKVSGVDSELRTKIGQAKCATDCEQWKTYTGAYTVPVGQVTTTFAFVSEGSASGSATFGNLLDNIYFSFVKPPRRNAVKVTTTAGGSVTISDGSMVSTVISDENSEYAKSLEYGNVLRLGVQPKDGYSFNGGYINGKLYHTKEAFLTMSKNMTWTVDENTPNEITILFSKNSTIIYNVQGGQHKAEQTLTPDGATQSETLIAPVKTNYAFKGWRIAGSDTDLKVDDTVTYVTNDKTGASHLEVSTGGEKLSYPIENGLILIAQWEYDDTVVTKVAFKLDYDDGKPLVAGATLETAAPEYTLPTATSETDRFVGWLYPMGEYDKLYAGGTKVLFEQNGAKPSVTIGGDYNVALEEMVMIAQWVPRQVTGVVIKEKPKASYEYGDSFNPAGLVVTVTYDNGTTQDVAYTGNEGKFTFDPAIADKLALADKDVKITYTENGKGHDLNLPIEVVAKKLTPTVTGVSGRVYNGNTTTTDGSITLTGVLAVDTVTVSGSIAFVDKNAGTNKKVNVTGITLSGASAGNYVLTDTTLTNAATTAEITAKPVTLTWGGTANRTYDGQASAVYATANDTITGDACTVTVIGGDKVAVGIYNATASISDTNYTISGTATTNYIIEKAVLTATYEGASVIYKDEVPSAALKVNVTGFVNGETDKSADMYSAPAVTVSDWSTLEVGTHELTPTGGTATNYSFDCKPGNLIVISRDFDAIIVHDYMGDYDGTAHKLTFESIDNKATDITFKYYPTKKDADDDTKGSDIPTSLTDAGTETVYYRVAATGFISQVGTGTITINKKTVTAVIATSKDKVYNGNDIASDFKLKLNGVILADVDTATAAGTIKFTDKNVGKNKTVVVSGVSITGSKKDNYTLTSNGFTASTTAKITAMPITLEWKGGGSLTYSGAAKNVTATIPTGDIPIDDSCTVTVTGGAEKNYKVGDYTATATLSSENYSLTNAMHTYTIAKAVLTAKFKNETIKFGAAPALVVEVTDFVGGESALTALGYKAPTIKTAIPTAVSITTIELNDNGTANNYSFTLDNTGKLTIEKANMSGVTATGYTGTYDGGAHGITVTAPEGSTITYSDNQAVPSTGNSYTDAGTYIVTYTITHPSYATVTGNVDVVINRKALTPTVKAGSVQGKGYDGTATTTGGTLELSGIINNEDVTASGTIVFVSKDVGKNKAVNVSGITLAGAKSNNYSPAAATLTNTATNAEITQKEVTLTWNGHTGLVYDGTMKTVTATAGNLLGGDSNTVILSGNTATIPGSYTATATGLSNTNYKLPEVVTQGYSIAKATITGVVATPINKIYDGTLSDGVIVTGAKAGDKLTYSIDGGNTWTTNIPQISAVGNTQITVKIVRDHHNDLTLASVTATVKNAPTVRIYKPIFDSVDVQKVTVGGIVTEGGNAIASQSFEIRKTGTASWTVLNAGTTSGKDTVYNQVHTALDVDTEYELRLTATDSVGTTAAATLKFRTQPKNPATGEIIGSVTGGTGKITVTLESGNTVVASIKDLDSGDTFTFSKLMNGEYNLVATDFTGKHVTMLATVKNGGTTTLTAMVIGLQQSAVEVKGDAPPVAADGLQELFLTKTYTNNPDATGAITGGGTVEIRLTADEAKNKSQKDDIEASIGTDVVGLFVDLTVDMFITPAGQPSTKKNLQTVDGLLTVAIPLPQAALNKTGYKMYRHHNGVVGELTQLAADGTPVEGSFRIENKYAYVYSSKFSTYAVTYTKNGGGTGGGGGSSGANPEYDFWMSVKEKIQTADAGDVVKVDAKGYDKVPASVMDTLRKNDGVSLVITWNGKTITIPAGKAPKNEAGRIYWPLSMLAELYADITEDTVLKQAPQNPETGGPSEFIPVTDGGELITMEAPTPAVEHTIPDGTENAQPITVTPPDSGFEADAYAGTPDAIAARGINPVAVAAAIMLLAGIGGALVLFGKRRKKEQE